MSYKYDFLVVGSGLYGATFANLAIQDKKKVLVIEKRNHIGGNVYTKNMDGIEVHVYGAHIFHTNNKEIWDFVNRFAKFNNYKNSPIANYKGEIYSLPFNMYTFNKMWGCISPDEAKKIIEEQKLSRNNEPPRNLEEQAISLVGKDVYQKLVKGYTEKQWGRDCNHLPPFIIKRLPVRFTYDNNYFNDYYQGIPINGYTLMIKNMLSGAEVILNEDYLKNYQYYDEIAKTVVYTGPIDEFFSYQFGPLEYRSLNFETEMLNIDNYQGNAVVNYTDKETKFTRIIEHKWFNFGLDAKGNSLKNNTIISKEYPLEWTVGIEPYYPILDKKNIDRLKRYTKLVQNSKHTIFGGRLGEYKYYNMDEVILSAINTYNNLK